MLGCFFQILKDFLCAVFGLIVICIIISVFTSTDTYTTTNKTSYNKYDEKIMQDFADVHRFMYIYTNGLRDYCSMYGYVPNKYIYLFNKKFSNTEKYAYARFENSLNPDDRKDIAKIIDYMDQELKPKSIEYFNKGFETFSKEHSGQTQNSYCRLYDIIPNEIINKQKDVFIKSKPHMYVE